MITLIVACDENQLIGASDKPGGIPWHCLEDFKHFKQTTLHHTLLMGSKTYETIGKPLPHRKTLVLSRRPLELPDGAEVVGDLDKVLKTYQNTSEELFICGGASVYAQAYPYADRILLSRIPGQYEGDAWLADFKDYFELDHCEKKETFTLEVYRRREYA